MTTLGRVVRKYPALAKHFRVHDVTAAGGFAAEVDSGLYALGHRTVGCFGDLDGRCPLCGPALARPLPLRRIFPRGWYHELSFLADKRTKVLCQNAGLSAFRRTRLGTRRGEGSPGPLSRSRGHFRRCRMYRDDSGTGHDLVDARFIAISRFILNRPVPATRIFLKPTHAAFRQDRSGN